MPFHWQAPVHHGSSVLLNFSSASHGLLNTLAPVTSVQARSSLLPFILHPAVKHRVPAFCSSTMESLRGNGKAKAQLLDATSLHLAVEAFYKPNFILYKDDVGSKGKDYKNECCETTFMEKKDKDVAVETPSTEDPQAKLLDENEVKIQTVSYEVEEEEYVEYE
ncbi:hypothetical protein PO909_010919 [Leuciscus waleckii]